MSLVSFPCLIVLAMTSSTVLKRNVREYILALILILVGKLLVSHDKYDDSCKIFVDFLFKKKSHQKKFPSVPSTGFYHEYALYFVKCFFSASTGMIFLC